MKIQLKYKYHADFDYLSRMIVKLKMKGIEPEKRSCLESLEEDIQAK